MKILAAAEAKNNFGKMIDLAQRSPITIAKKGRAVVVVLSMEEYNKFELLEDELWNRKALEAKNNGFIGQEKSANLIQRLLNAGD